MGSIRVDQQTWHPAKVAGETAPARGGARLEWIVLRFLLYVVLVGAAGTVRDANPVVSNHAYLIGTVALAGLACSCRRSA